MGDFSNTLFSMRVRVLLFGMLKDLTGKSEDCVDLREGASVQDLLAHYGSVPRFHGILNSIAVAVNQQYAAADTVLKPSDEVALLPPVSGGLPDSSTAPDRDMALGNGQRCATIVRCPIDTQKTLSRLKQGEDGAVVVFEGIVRNQTRGRRTLYLDYEAYEGMALQELEGLASQAVQKFRIRDVAITHRLGKLEIGETSVLIVVVSPHRGPAFDACRWIIDTLKRTVPIWKKEYFEDGAVWADGEPFPAEIPPANS